jgi:hypothetical protein
MTYGDLIGEIIGCLVVSRAQCDTLKFEQIIALNLRLRGGHRLTCSRSDTLTPQLSVADCVLAHKHSH